jgi:hypothetical protein
MKDARTGLLIAAAVAVLALGVGNSRLRTENRRLSASFRRYAAAVPLAPPGALPLRPTVQEAVVRIRDDLAQGRYESVTQRLDGLVAELAAVPTVGDLGPELVAARAFLVANPKWRDRIVSLVAESGAKARQNLDVGPARSILRDALLAAAKGDDKQVAAKLVEAEKALASATPRTPARPASKRQLRPSPSRAVSKLPVAPLPVPPLGSKLVDTGMKELKQPYAFAERLMIEGLEPVAMIMAQATARAREKRYEEAAWLLERAAYLLGLRPLKLPGATGKAKGKAPEPPPPPRITAEQVKPRLDLCQAMIASKQSAGESVYPEGESVYPADEFLAKAQQYFDQEDYADADWAIDIALSVLGMSRTEIEALKQGAPAEAAPASSAATGAPGRDEEVEE